MDMISGQLVVTISDLILLTWEVGSHWNMWHSFMTISKVIEIIQQNE